MMADELLDPAKLIAAARSETGLTLFDDPGIEEPLERLTRALRTEAKLNDVGVHTWKARIHNTLVARLRARDWFDKKPEILDEIRATADLGDATAAKLKSAVEAYAKTFA